MLCSKHKKIIPVTNPCQTSRNICPRCTRSNKNVNRRRSSGLLTYYKKLCKSTRCLIHSGKYSAKNKNSGISLPGKRASQIKKNGEQISQKKDLRTFPCAVDEFEDEKDFLDDIDLNMFTKIDAAVEDLDSSMAMNFENTPGNRLLKEIINKTVIWPLKKPEIFKGLRSAPKGVLLFGPPGSGKTFLGKLIARETSSTFFNISPSILTSKWMGENEKLVRTMFLVAKARQPSVIFIDEIDSILSKTIPQENGSTRRMKNEFLFCMEERSTVEDRVMVIGATNHPHELDEGAIHRFVKRFYIPLPDYKDRKEILLKLLEQECHSLEDIDVCDIVKRTEGYSVADIKNLCQEAAMGPIKGLARSAIIRLKADKIRPISIEDFLWALELIKPTVSLEQVKAYEEWDSLYGYGGESNTVPKYMGQCQGLIPESRKKNLYIYQIFNETKVYGKYNPLDHHIKCARNFKNLATLRINM